MILTHRGTTWLCQGWIPPHIHFLESFSRLSLVSLTAPPSSCREKESSGVAAQVRLPCRQMTNKWPRNWAPDNRLFSTITCLMLLCLRSRSLLSDWWGMVERHSGQWVIAPSNDFLQPYKRPVHSSWQWNIVSSSNIFTQEKIPVRRRGNNYNYTINEIKIIKIIKAAKIKSRKLRCDFVFFFCFFSKNKSNIFPQWSLVRLGIFWPITWLLLRWWHHWELWEFCLGE